MTKYSSKPRHVARVEDRGGVAFRMHHDVRGDVAGRAPCRADQSEAGHPVGPAGGHGPGQVTTERVPADQEPLVTDHAVEEVQEHLHHVVVASQT